MHRCKWGRNAGVTALILPHRRGGWRRLTVYPPRVLGDSSPCNHSGPLSFYYQPVQVPWPSLKTVSIAYACSIAVWAAIAFAVGVQQAYFENNIHTGEYRLRGGGGVFLRFFCFSRRYSPSH